MRSDHWKHRGHTITTGNAEDLDGGYTLTMDQGAAGAFGINATQTFSQLTPGNHTVTLGDLAENCTLDDGENPRTLAVVAGQTTQTTFNLTCAPTKGSIQVTTVTQGDAQDLDPDGYTVIIDQGTPSAIAINATETYTQILEGAHTVTLGDVAGTCTLTGENPRNVDVVAGQTAQVVFNVTCGALTGIKVTTFINGVFLPTTLTVALLPGAPTPIGANATLEFSPLAPGNYDVFLQGIPKTCIAGEPNPKTIVLNAGELATAFFVLQCVPPNGIAFEQVSTRGDKDICVLDPYVDNPVPFCLTGGPGDTADDVHPVWGPNQEWLLFSSDRDGDFETLQDERRWDWRYPTHKQRFLRRGSGHLLQWSKGPVHQRQLGEQGHMGNGPYPAREPCNPIHHQRGNRLESHLFLGQRNLGVHKCPRRRLGHMAGWSRRWERGSANHQRPQQR